jgi:hypothetical protein
MITHSRIRKAVDTDLDKLTRRLAVAQRVVETALAAELSGEISDLDLIDAVIEQGVLGDSPYGVRCFALVFGCVLAEELDGFEWTVIEEDDDYALQYAGTSLVVHPSAILEAELQRGRSAREAFRETVVQVERLVREHRTLH